MRGPGGLRRAALEDWLRERYFRATTDISSSGVHNYPLGALRELDADLREDELDRLVFRDGPPTGTERLRTAIAARVRPGPDHTVMTTHGSSEALFLAFHALLAPGDEVVVPAPAYHSLAVLPASLGAVLRVWPLRPENGFQPDLDDLREVLSPRTRLVVVNFPHNPTGACLDPADRAPFLDLVERSGATLLWDGAFADLTLDHPPLPDPTRDLERSLSFGTLSKAYGLPGLRVGWCVLPTRLVPEFLRYRDYLTLSLSPLIELLAAVAVENAEALITPRLIEARENRKRLRQWAAARPDVVDCVVPRGGVTAFPRFPGHPDTTALCETLLTDHGVLTVPGDCFGHPDRMRVGFSLPAADLNRALDVVASVAVRTASPQGAAP
ncbi:capreomycidine synthase [Streptomyces roseolilacinus]|uniref:capreomycidine synthase n=1 Tax=Streptomyces roseolilacinus TaxID=66904 RepID=UPI0037F9BB55